jgi:HlyD family secretion protein
MGRARVIVTGVAVAGLVLLGGAAWWRSCTQPQGGLALRTVSVKRADLLATIAATGTVEPEELVDVGAQVAGQINTFGRDVDGKTVDYGSSVDVGTVLAKIDDSLYAADLHQAQANLRSAEANVLQAQAKLGQARRDWERAQKLGPSDALAPSAYDQYQAAFEIAEAGVEVAQAAVAQARASVARAERNLGYCTITSPVKGVIIDRRVNIGQTVVSSLNAPSLFLIAKDLKRIEVWVSVNEADIGNIHRGQPVTFTVDAFPGETFHGEVNKVRLNATMTQNVVTYTVVVSTDNSDGRLLPYLTANVQFEEGRRQNVLVVPNAALRWWPQPDRIPPEYRDLAAASGDSGQPNGIVWADRAGSLQAITVTTGLTDGTLTEVQGNELTEGLPVVVGEQLGAAGGANEGAGASPFAPRPLGRSRPADGSGRGGGT